jgi:large repetitive protein
VLSTETYDNNGNTTFTGGKTLGYDSENHLISMTEAGTTVSMKYDAFGNRVSKTVNGVTTQYLVEDDVNPTGYPQVLDELTGSAVTRTYTFGLQRISENLSPSVTGNAAWTPSFYGYDGGGSVRQLTNSVGQVMYSYEYDAFGNSFTKQGTTPNNYLYRDEQYDSDLGLYYLRARYYNPNTGRHRPALRSSEHSLRGGSSAIARGGSSLGDVRLCPASGPRTARRTHRQPLLLARPDPRSGFRRRRRRAP